MTEERRIRTNIRNRDRKAYRKLHGAIPEGYTMHHNYYNPLWYDEDSFIIITKEEHEWIHGRKIQSSKGFEYRETEYSKEDIRQRNKAYREKNAEELKAKKKEYYEEHKDRYAEKRKKYAKEHSEHIKEYQKKYKEEHKEKAKEYHTEYMRAYRAKKKLEKESGEN